MHPAPPLTSQPSTPVNWLLQPAGRAMRVQTLHQRNRFATSLMIVAK